MSAGMEFSWLAWALAALPRHCRRVSRDDLPGAQAHAD